MRGSSRSTAAGLRRVRITVRGRVQGVGFRPTLYRALTRRGCAGRIRNTPQGVVLELEAHPRTVQDVLDRFGELIPERARVDDMEVEEAEPTGEAEFTIEQSSSHGQSLLPIPPDLATCEECLAELRNAADRRHRYPFNTCTACGPRFTIARGIPFDRPTSTMEEFPLCPACGEEYGSPADRRFHAQTMSCPECGPRLSFALLQNGSVRFTEDDPVGRATEALKAGRMVAIKGLGGFHLGCDAMREEVVEELRRRKQRPHKPLAVMVRDLAACRRLCVVPPKAEEMLSSPQAPIVLLEKRAGCPVAEAVAPGLKHLGVMLPYTPLHLMLFQDPELPPALVMTSCNRSDEPIAIGSAEVTGALSDVVDAVLRHDRQIANRCDDSVVALFADRPLPMRRSRGYTPEPIFLQRSGPSVLGTGAMWKNTFALTSGRRAFLSQHIGDVSDADNAAYFGECVERFCDLLGLEPEVVACDTHPDYPSTDFARRLAAERGLELIQVQHHHAHVASCLAEHGCEGPVIGVSMDGTGYEEDGAVWGGEFLLADLEGYERRYHLEYVPMPGAEQAILEPDRMALSHLAQALGADEALQRMAPRLGAERARALLAVAQKADFSPPTSSCGRLFDAVSALLDVRHRVTYEGQAACELEAICREGESGVYQFEFDAESILVGPLLRGVCADLDAGLAPGRIATRFHNTIAELILETCRRLRGSGGPRAVALSGGVMQNRRLLSRVVPALQEEGFDVLLQTTVPPNDGGICLGQVACALARLGET